MLLDTYDTRLLADVLSNIIYLLARRATKPYKLSSVDPDKYPPNSKSEGNCTGNDPSSNRCRGPNAKAEVIIILSQLTPVLNVSNHRGEDGQGCQTCQQKANDNERRRQVIDLLRSHFIAGHDHPVTGKEERFRGEQPRNAVIYQFVFEPAVFIELFLCFRFQIGCLRESWFYSRFSRCVFAAA
jgi:hypothetical protein